MFYTEVFDKILIVNITIYFFVFANHKVYFTHVCKERVANYGILFLLTYIKQNLLKLQFLGSIFKNGKKDRINSSKRLYILSAKYKTRSIELQFVDLASRDGIKHDSLLARDAILNFFWFAYTNESAAFC